MQSKEEILEAIYCVDSLYSNAEESEKEELSKIKSYLQSLTREKENKKEYKGFGL